MNPLEVVSLGIVVADVIARPVSGTAIKGTLELVDEVVLRSGGSAASTGYALARFGIKSAVLGRIGNDGFGDFLEHEASRHGAESLLVHDPSVATSATQVLVDADGERTFLHAVGANARLVASDVDLESLKARGTKILHLAGFFTLPSLDNPNGEPTRELFARAKAMGFITSLDNVWDATGHWERIHPVLPYADFFYPSIRDAQLITGLQEPIEIAQRLFEMGVGQIVAIKMGPEGSFVMNRAGESQRLGILNVPSVDGTGAGDAFIAGFLAAWLRGMSLLECAQYGTAGGAMGVRAMGAMTGITDWAELSQMAANVSIL